MKRIFTILTLFVATIGFAQNSCVSASYPFNGNANDESGNGNDGTVNGATLTTDRFGNANSAYSFDGISEYISNSSPFTNDVPFSITSWIYIEDTISNTNPIYTFGYSASGLNQLEFGTVGGYLSAFTAGANDVSALTAIVPTNQWVHVACVHTTGYTIGAFTFYINGIPYSADHQGGTNNPFPTASTGAIGTGRSNDYFGGKLDDLKIFDCALSTNEIDSLYQSESTMCTVYDTIQVMDTTFVTVYDTTYVTETTYDTVLVSVEDTLNIDVALSLPAPNNVNTILVYPNPAKTNITIDNGNYANMSGYSITITNTISQVMFTGLINQQTFDVDISSWSGGTYFINIIDSGGLTVDTRQIVKF